MFGGKKVHKFLRAIGFSDITKKDLDILIEEIKERPELMKVTTDSEGNEIINRKQTVKNVGK